MNFFSQFRQSFDVSIILVLVWFSFRNIFWKWFCPYDKNCIKCYFIYPNPSRPHHHMKSHVERYKMSTELIILGRSGGKKVDNGRVQKYSMFDSLPKSRTLNIVISKNGSSVLDFHSNIVYSAIHNANKAQKCMGKYLQISI